MTIKPKKKTVKEKNDQTQDSACIAGDNSVGHGLTHNHPHTHGHSHPLYHHSTATESRLEKQSRVRNSPPPRWLPSTSKSRDDVSLQVQGKNQNLTSAATYDFEGVDQPLNHKRRHRSSPHRTVRKHRNHPSNVISNAVSVNQATTANNSDYNNASINNNLEIDDCDEEYNSGDEHTEPPAVPENINELEQWFEDALKEKKGFVIKKMGEDGACLFRAVADQVYGDQDMHGAVRKLCLDYMAKNVDFYSQYVTEDFTTYINRKRLDSCHGNHLEIQAMTELFNRPVEVYQYSLEPMNTFDTAYKTDNAPIRLSYHGNVHYNSIVDPYSASIGVGLGLPGHQPGLADKNQLRDAVKNSENYHIEQTMLADKLRETDWEVTQDSIEEQVARESYLHWLRDQQKCSHQNKGQTKTASATCSSTELSHANPLEVGPMRSPRQLRSGNNSPLHLDDHLTSLPGSSKSPRLSPPQRSPSQRSPSHSAASLTSDMNSATSVGPNFNETASLMNHIPPAFYGMSDWSEEDILAQVMAQSQQDYLDSLKKKASSSSTLSAHSNPSTSASSSSSANFGSAGFSGGAAGYSGGVQSSSSHHYSKKKSSHS